MNKLPYEDIGEKLYQFDTEQKDKVKERNLELLEITGHLLRRSKFEAPYGYVEMLAFSALIALVENGFSIKEAKQRLRMTLDDLTVFGVPTEEEMEMCFEILEEETPL